MRIRWVLQKSEIRPPTRCRGHPGRVLVAFVRHLLHENPRVPAFSFRPGQRHPRAVPQRLFPTGIECRTKRHSTRTACNPISPRTQPR
jgi:hypothetical protein